MDIVDNTMTRRTAALYIALLLCTVSAWADTPPLEGERPGSGWRQDSSGQWRGTGENFGRGWRRDASGNLHGTGENFGRGWRHKSDGGWSGTGENFGQGWAPRGR